MVMRVMLAPTWELAESLDAHVSIEAEYGSRVKEGNLLTLAHHQAEGPYSSVHSPAPCNAGPQIEGAKQALKAALDDDGEIQVVVSHLDLDTVGGCLRVVAALTELSGDQKLFQRESFWKLAEFADLNGPHKLGQSGASDTDVLALHAYWAWTRGRPRRPLDSVTDVTKEILEAARVLCRLMDGDDKLLAAGRELMRKNEELNSSSFIEVVNGVAVRVANHFVNHLYAAPGGVEVAKAVITFSPATGAITVSLESPVEGVSCRDIVQALWGQEAGGHVGIAGSPRGERMGLDDLVRARDALIEALG